MTTPKRRTPKQIARRLALPFGLTALFSLVAVFADSHHAIEPNVRAVYARTSAQSDISWPVVVRVLDAQTISIAPPGQGLEVVRLIGIETPTPDACYGREALLFVRSRLVGGSRIFLIDDPTQPNRDDGGRLLRHVLFETDPNAPLTPAMSPAMGTRVPMSIAQLLVRGGYARTKRLPVPSMYSPQLQMGETFAREEGAGLWATDTCDGMIETGEETDRSGNSSATLPDPPTVEVPPAVRILLGNDPAIAQAFAPGNAAIATVMASSAEMMATIAAIVTAIPTIVTSYQPIPNTTDDQTPVPTRTPRP